MNAYASLPSQDSRSSLTSALARLAGALVLVLALPLAARADVPGRVGRIAFMQGDVQAYSDSDPEWKAAYLNQPITSRNSIFVGDAGRAEISVGSTTLAMDAASQVDIQQLDDNTFNANVVRGRVSIRVRRFDPSDQYNVATPGADFALLQPGRYRIDSLESASGITVFEGQASVQGDRGASLVNAGSAIRVAGNPSNPNAAPELLAAAPVPVPLDDWVLARESRFRDSQAARYVSPNMTGYEDLDANGRWSTEADVGPVWYPSTYVQADWAPYRYGRWAYVEPWGYTWVDDAPWGFAPFHYGRWIQVGGRWGWCPGAYVARPVYAPALVGFYGGDGFSASFSIGAGPAVGWYPLAPWQRYAPHYTRNTAYINQVNNITIVNPPQRFGGGRGREWNRDNGGTLAPRDAFASQRSISRVAMAAPRGFADRAATVEVNQLPRPANVPGAVRRGPGNEGEGRPEFRSPREFANQPGRGPERGGNPAAVVGPQQENPRAERGNLPPNYQRMRDENRPGAVDVRSGQPLAPNTTIQTERPVPVRGGPNAPQFNREQRPMAQETGVEGQQPARAITQQPQQQQPQRFQQPARNEEQPRPQPQQQTPQFQQQPQQAAPVERFERPNRENRETRNVQQPPQGMERPQVVERQQQQPQQRFERPAPVAPAAVPAPQAPRVEQPRVEQPRPQPQPQPQRVEQPRVEQPRPQPQQQQQPAQPQGGQPERGPRTIDRER